MTKISDVYELTSKADTGGMEKAIDATERLDKAQESVGDNSKKSAIDYTRLNSAVELGTKAFGIAQEVITQTIGKQIELADQTDTLSRALGVSAEEASKLMYVTKMVGISQEDLKGAMEGAISKGLDPSLAGLEKLSKQYNDIQDPIQRSKFLLDNFGGAGMKLGALFEKGADGIRAMADEAESFGAVLDEKAIKATKEFEVQLKKLEARADGVKSKVGAALIDIGNKTFEYYEGIGNNMQGVSEKETQLRQLIIANAFLYGEESFQVKQLSSALQLLLIDQQAILMTSQEQNVRSEMAKVRTLELGEAYYGTKDGLKAYYEAMVDANTVTSDADAATRSLTLGTQDLTTAFIYNQAAQKLAPEAALKLGVAMGIVKKETLETVTALDTARKAADSNMDGFIDAGEAARGYVGDIDAIAQAVAMLQDKKIEVTVETINRQVSINEQINAIDRPGMGVAPGPQNIADTLRNRGLK